MVHLGTGETYVAYCLTTEAERETLPPFSFDFFLYLQPKHVALQAGPDWRMFVLLNTQTNQIDGVAHFFRDADTAFSPWRAPFGGLQLHPAVPQETSAAYLHYLHQTLQQLGITQIKWLQCPDAYAPKSSAWLRTQLPVLRYHVQHDQLNHHIEVSGNNFAAQVHPSAKRRLLKCQKAGFTFRQETLEELPEAYAFLKQCRLEKQKPLSLSLPQLSRYFELFPDRYFLFTVRRGAELAAVGVAVLVAKKILNHLYPASPTRFNEYSPSVLLNAGLYAFCQEHQISMLDLGVSAPATESEEAYTGLITFKERLGGIPTRKPTFLWRGEAKE
ncbi:GNAT family N-acetyltransferase [Rufibacter latericius]|uniref:Uncharacterized protein n=1 Tax=Rufibacter latericius TaxID=2487040 RepID=A0A3M9N1D2_9BACT|nr:GNAT family N-acetyltransferase [Rufibacter latericius]RNI31205.1 hypothetical protein EFB08_01335 [Rufibacter latericius]